MELSNHFTKFMCNNIKEMYKITSVEEAQALSDFELMKVRHVGKMFIQKLRSIKVQPLSIPTRQFCAICGQIHKIDFWVPNAIWNTAIHQSYQNSIVCLNCFMARADEKFLPWDDDIKLYPTSAYTQRGIKQAEGLIKDANEIFQEKAFEGDNGSMVGKSY